MRRRQGATDAGDRPKANEDEDLRLKVDRLQAGMTTIIEMMKDMKAQMAGVTGSISQPRTMPWKEVFGDRYKAVLKTLNKYIPYKAISSIQYRDGTRIPYVTGFYVYSAMNAIFGPDTWSYTASTVRDGTGLYSATVTISISGVIRSNGSANKQTKGIAPEQLAIKAAITGAFKRAAANFGNVLGLCLYDKEYIKEFVNYKKESKEPQDERSVIEWLYNESHPEDTVSEAPLQKRKVAELHKEGVEEGSIVDLKTPTAIQTDSITRMDTENVTMVPVGQQEEGKTRYTEFFPNNKVITRIETDIPQKSTTPTNADDDSFINDIIGNMNVETTNQSTSNTGGGVPIDDSELMGLDLW